MRPRLVLLGWCLVNFFLPLTAQSAHDPAQVPNNSRQAPAPTAKPAYIGSLPFALLAGHKVEEDDPGVHNFSFFHPNEFFGHLFETQFAEKGALITVGTFRGLNNASKGNVSHLVLFDYNRGIKLFNLINLQLVAMAKDRWEYMSLMLTGERNEALIERARKAKNFDPAEFIHLLTKDLDERGSENYVKKVSFATGIKISDKWKTSGVKLPEAKDWFDLDNGENKIDPLEYYLYREMNKAAKSYKANGTMGETIFGDDARFETIQGMVRNGKVTVVQGDLFSKKALVSIGEALRKENIPLAAIDLSNVPGATNDTDVTPSEVWGKMKSALETLPIGSKTRLFMTTHFDLFTSPERAKANGVEVRHNLPTDDSWYYYAFSPKELPAIDQIFRSQDGEDKYRRSDTLERKLDRLFEPDPADKTGYQLLRLPKKGSGDAVPR